MNPAPWNSPRHPTHTVIYQGNISTTVSSTSVQREIIGYGVGGTKEGPTTTVQNSEQQRQCLWWCQRCFVTEVFATAALGISAAARNMSATAVNMSAVVVDTPTIALNTSDQESETVKMLFLIRGTTLEKTSGARNAESEAKSAPELKNTYYSPFFSPLSFSLDFISIFLPF